MVTMNVKMFKQQSLLLGTSLRPLVCGQTSLTVTFELLTLSI